MSLSFKLVDSLPHTKEKKPGLSDMIVLDRSLGYPSRSFASVHVAGTNGKGSVSLKMARTLELTSKKVGLFLSPHIATFHERISIGGVCIPEEEAIEGFQTILRIASEKNLIPTFFEAMTLLAFHYFSKEKVDIAVLEVGMGGRLDSTNIINPLISVITSIDYDHMQYLGETKDEIAREKGGIIKPNVPVVLGPEARSPSLFEIAREKCSPIIEVEGQFSNFEEENRAIARSALYHLGIPYEIVEKGVLHTPPCRFEVLDPTLPLILDVAHNPAGFRALFKRIQLTYPNKPFRALAAFSKGKEINEIFPILRANCTAVHLTGSDHSRLLKIEDYNESDFFLDSSLHQSLDRVLHLAKEQGEGVVICGTFFIMAEVKESLDLSVL